MSVLVRAARIVALDLEGSGEGVGGLGEVGPQRSLRKFMQRVTSHAVSRLRETDAVLAQMVAELLRDPRSPAAYPVLVAGAVAGTHRLKDRALLDGLSALSMFVLAHDLTAMVGGRERSSNAADAAAITLADCLLTEATAVMARLPDEPARAIAAATNRSAAARHDLEDKGTTAVLNNIYMRLAAPTVCAAELAGGDSGYTAVRTRSMFAEWYAATRQALNDFLRGRDPRLVPFLVEQLDLQPFDIAASDLPLKTLASELSDEVAALLGTSARLAVL